MACGGPLLGACDARIFHRAFSDQTCERWAADGRLLASGVQLAWYQR